MKFAYEITTTNKARARAINGAVVGVRSVGTYNFAVVSTDEYGKIITHALTVSKRTAYAIKSQKQKDLLRLANAYAIERGTLNENFKKLSMPQRYNARTFEKSLEEAAQTLEIYEVVAVPLTNI